jgi:glycosyltransferase involved in cell wall biosynthesis/peptidoglycan/xylan/chitin deacetylase (PgdA/CDA1 family)
MAAISVVIPAYNRESTLSVSLDSLLAQTHADWEAIVVDDGSADGTYAIAAAYAERDRRVRIKRQENAGVSAARNAALALAQNPWVLFLDADDWISADAFSLLSAALDRDPQVDAVHGNCIRVLADGTEAREPPPPPSSELFQTFAHTCAFSIHTCLVRTDLVRGVGGFDESLVTCEDWDLWQRVVRTGPRFAFIPANIAYYRIRTTSASRNGERLLRDGLSVLARGHGDDPRLASWPGALKRGRPIELASTARLYLTAYAAGLSLAAGGDARELLALVPDGAPGDVEGDGVAETIFFSTVEARAAVPAAWSSFPPDLQERLDLFLAALAEKTHDNWLHFVATQALERLVLEHHGSGERTLIGSTQLCPIAVGQPIGHIALRPAVRRVVLDVLRDGEQVGSVVVPGVDGILPGIVAADAIADELGWDLLERFFGETIYPTLRVEQGAAHLTVHRGATLLADVDISSAERVGHAVHDCAGWAVFLQELWGLPDWEQQRFYRSRRRESWNERASKTLSAADGPPVIEVADELPEIHHVSDPLAVVVTLGGVPMMVVRVAPTRGRIRPDALRRAISFAGGYELCLLAVREGLLAAWPSEMPLRARLSEAARRRREAAAARSSEAPSVGSPRREEIWWPLIDEAVPEGCRALIFGRRSRGSLGLSISRTASVPVEETAQMLSAARAAGEPVIEVGDPSAQAIALYAPFVIDLAVVPIEHGAPTASQGEDGPARNGASGADYRADLEDVRVEQERSAVPGRITRALERVTGQRRPRAGSGEAVSRAGAALAESVPGASGLRSAKGNGYGQDDEHPGSATKQMPILMYHQVADSVSGPSRRWSVTPAELEEQLAFLQAGGFYSLPIESWAQAGAADRPINGRPVVLTFDDGFADFAESAVPLLEKYGFQAEVFIVTGYVGGENGWETAWRAHDRLMDWGTLEALPPATVRIGSHTHTHQMLPAVSTEEAMRELVTSRITLEDRLGRAVSSVAYPYGPADGAVARLTGAAGYQFAYTTLHWWAHVGRDLLRLPRLEVRGGQPIGDFEQMLSQPF